MDIMNKTIDYTLSSIAHMRAHVRLNNPHYAKRFKCRRNCFKSAIVST